MWDAHCHLDDPRIIDDLDGVMSRARAAGVEGVIIAGYGPDRWPQQRDIASRYDDVYVTFGLHPWLIADVATAPAPPSDQDLIDALVAVVDAIPAQGKLVGLGELGLDRSKRCSEQSWARQQRLCREQLALARERDLPVVLHVVQAHGAMLDLLRDDGLPQAGGMIHGFTGSPGLAAAYLQLGLHISCGGRLTHTSARKVRETVASIPEPWLLAETDAPDMPPATIPSDAPNEPAYLPLIIQTMAELRGQTAQDVAALTQDNARRLFGRS